VSALGVEVLSNSMWAEGAVSACALAVNDPKEECEPKCLLVVDGLMLQHQAFRGRGRLTFPFPE
jgi:hypothetical protein